ncbi:MAG: lytic transglycosylase domain-containing protein [Pseudomonadota bacterium]
MKRLRLSAAILAASMVVATSVQAESASPPPFPKFTFKRVKPPTASTQQRITVQIEPRKPAALAPADDGAAIAAAAAPAAATGDYPWFWAATSPARGDAGAGRLFDVVDLLAANPTVATPRLGDLQAIAAAHDVSLLKASIGTRVSPAFALAVIAVESGGRADAVSRAGAQGLMQLMPDTATEMGVTDPMVPEDNIAGGVRLLDRLMAAYDDDPILVLAAYNAGQGAVRDHDGVPPYAETRNYVPRVMAAWTVARALCKTPPLLLSDGCVFTVSGTN